MNMTPQPPPLPQVDREELRNKIEKLLADDWACTRVWEAWQYGTMTQDDFQPLNETERVDEFLVLFDQHLQVAVDEARISEAKLARKQFVQAVDDFDFIVANGERIAQLAQPNPPNNDKEKS